jgi:hypothetical protein
MDGLKTGWPVEINATLFGPEVRPASTARRENNGPLAAGSWKSNKIETTLRAGEFGFQLQARLLGCMQGIDAAAIRREDRIAVKGWDVRQGDG